MIPFKTIEDLSKDIEEAQANKDLARRTKNSIVTFKHLIDNIINNKSIITKVFFYNEEYVKVNTVKGVYEVPVVYVTIKGKDNIYKTDLFNLVKNLYYIDMFDVLCIDYTLFNYTHYLTKLVVD